MNISFICPNCGLETEVPGHLAGRSGPCAGCGKPIQIPSQQAYRKQAQHDASRNRTKPVDVFLLVVVASVLATIFIGVTLAIVFLPRLTLNPITRQVPSRSNLVSIGQAIQRYASANGHLPPAYVADQQGQPAHSWRVLLLPYLGEQLLYEQYDFTQPWNSPVNLRLANQMPAVYGSPDDPDAKFGDTSYLVITGPEAAFDRDATRKITDISDPLGATILVVESAGWGVNWLEPRDLNLDDMPLRVNSGQRGGINNAKQGGGAYVLLADGTVVQLSDQTSINVLREMITIRDGRSATPLGK